MKRKTPASAGVFHCFNFCYNKGMNKIRFIGLISLIGLIGLVGPIRPIHATTIVDGDLIRAENSVDVYIVKIVGTKQFKRLILNPEIFNQYGHLKWENIKNVNQEEVDEYTTSDLVRAVGDNRVYKLYPNGDTGEKRWIKTLDDFVGLKYDWDAIYEINNFERDYYSTGEDLVFSTPTTPIPPVTPTPPSRNPITINIPADYKTIQAAIDVAIDGDTISVQFGTYNENLVIDKKLRLLGEMSGSTIIDGTGKGNAVTIVGAKDVSIERFTIQSDDKYAIYCPGQNQTSATFKNLIIKDSGWGVVAESNCQLTILNSLFYNNRNSANTDGAGILVKNNSSYNITTEIRNNTIDDNYHGIWSENSNVKIMNNIVTSNIGGKGTVGDIGVYHSGSGQSDNTYNDVYGNASEYGGDATPGSGSLVLLPKFIWPSQRDYRLKTGATDYSPCLDAGNPDYIYNDGILSTKTYRNDMGAYGGPDNIGWNP